MLYKYRDVHTNIHLVICLYIHCCVYIYIYIWKYYVCRCEYVYIHAYIYRYMYKQCIYTYAHMHICIYHIYIHVYRWKDLPAKLRSSSKAASPGSSTQVKGGGWAPKRGLSGLLDLGLGIGLRAGRSRRSRCRRFATPAERRSCWGSMRVLGKD